MLKIITNYFRRHFGFSRSEIRGILILAPILILFLFGPNVLKKYFQSRPLPEKKEDIKKLRAWYSETIRQQHSDSLLQGFQSRFFDPNKISKEEWLQLGFKAEVADRIVKYRLAGGTFYEKEDLNKIYGISKRLVNAYQENIVIEAKRPKPKDNWLKKWKKEQKHTAKATKPKLSEPPKIKLKSPLNLADTSQLRKIRGIGKKLSSRIVKYRNALGGFYKNEQLHEVYGLKPEVINRLFEDFEITGRHLRGIDINLITNDSLVKHPYFNYKLSNAIINYRDQHGTFTNKSDLQEIKILSDSLYHKIEPYLIISSNE